MTKEFEFVQDIMPSGGIPLASLRLVYFLADNGKPKYRFIWEGEGSSTDIIGILEVIKSELVLESYRMGGKDDD